MGTGRLWHTTTLLPSGKVLIVGGTNNILWDALNSAEIYDYADGAFTATGSMSAARYSHTASLLPDGKVLIAGGMNAGGSTAGAERYEPATGVFTATGSMITSRRDHTATLLPNGKVLIAGGYGSNYGNYLNTAELYDPAAGTFAATGSLTTARQNHSATLLPDGRVLVTGGTNGSGDLMTAELYDPATGTFTATGSMTMARKYHTATLLPDGRVLITGGYGEPLYSAELYDPATGTFTATGGMATGRWWHTATLLPNGKVLIAGGYNNDHMYHFVSKAEVYDPATGLFSATGNLVAGRLLHTANLLASGKVLITGGYTYDGLNALFNKAELYDPASGVFTAVGNMTGGRQYHTATLLPNGRVLIAGGGGYYGNDYTNSAELYDPGLGFNDAWRPVVSSIAFDPAQPTKMIVAGSGFRGTSEASSGNYTNSATNYPILQLQRVDNGQTTFILSDPAAMWSETSFTSASVSGLPGGTYRATMFVNAIPSVGQLIVIESKVPVTVETFPAGLSFTVDGTTYTGAQTFTWTVGSSHTIATTSPQAEAAGMRYAFSSWSDGGAIEHVVTVPSMATTYTANFGTEYQLTTAVSPTGSGTAAPASGGWYAAGSVVNISAAPAAGYAFTFWTGPVASNASTPTTVTMSGPISVTANMGPSPALEAKIAGRSGPAAARVWTITVTNGKNAGTALSAQITGLTLTQTDGPACTPVILGPAFPLPLGNIAPRGSVSQNVTIDFSSCTSNSRFTVTIPFAANSGTYTGSSTLTKISR
jgi:hypothetical protein